MARQSNLPPVVGDDHAGLWTTTVMKHPELRQTAPALAWLIAAAIVALFLSSLQASDLDRVRPGGVSPRHTQATWSIAPAVDAWMNRTQ